VKQTNKSIDTWREEKGFGPTGGLKEKREVEGEGRPVAVDASSLI